jgi:hypothetical protein
MSTKKTESAGSMTPTRARRAFQQATAAMPVAEAKRIVTGAVKQAAKGKSAKQAAARARFYAAWDKGAQSQSRVLK